MKAVTSLPFPEAWLNAKPKRGYLNVSKNFVSDWERGVKKPGGPALRLLLTVIQKKGLEAIA